MYIMIITPKTLPAKAQITLSALSSAACVTTSGCADAVLVDSCDGREARGIRTNGSTLARDRSTSSETQEQTCLPVGLDDQSAIPAARLNEKNAYRIYLKIEFVILH